LTVVDEVGHNMGAPGVVDALVAATDKYAAHGGRY
jgi:proline iminopeptidase